MLVRESLIKVKIVRNYSDYIYFQFCSFLLSFLFCLT